MTKRAITKSEVDKLDERTRSAESIMRFILTVQKDSLAKAEKLRRLAMRVVESRGNAPSRGRESVRSTALSELMLFAAQLLPFRKQVKMTPKQRKAYRKIMGAGR